VVEAVVVVVVAVEVEVAVVVAAVAAATGEVLVVETGPRATISRVGHSRTTNSRVGKVKLVLL